LPRTGRTRPVPPRADRATDHLGRSLDAEADLVTWYKFTLYSDWLDIFSLAKWRFDGQEVRGECQDYLLSRQYRRKMESIAARG
jgi:hypothetical protein